MIPLLALGPGAFWPTTGAGWIALTVSAITLVLVPVGYGKWLEKMNGLGKRVTDVEVDQEKAAGRDDERRMQLERILSQHEQLIERIGASKTSADRCLEDAERHAIELGARVSDLSATVNASTLAISQRLTAVETELRLVKKP